MLLRQHSSYTPPNRTGGKKKKVEVLLEKDALLKQVIEEVVAEGKIRAKALGEEVTISSIEDVRKTLFNVMNKMVLDDSYSVDEEVAVKIAKTLLAWWL